MTDKFEFTTEERAETLRLYAELKDRIGDSLAEGDEQKIRAHLSQLMEHHQLQRNVF